MRRCVRQLAFAIVSTTAALPAAASGDEDERRISIGARTSLVTIDAFDTSGTTEAYGGTLGLSWGVKDWLDVGGDAGYVVRPNARLSDAAVSGVGGDGFRLFANLHAVELAGHARFVVEGGALYRVRPILLVRAGLGLRLLAAPDLYDETDRFVLAADTDSSLFPFVGGGAGLAWRIGEHLQLAGIATGTFSPDQREVGLSLEASWFSYDLL
jgi:hypothetical protein